MQFDMSLVESAPDWLLQKLGSSHKEELILIAKVLYGIWFFRNKKVWEHKLVNGTIAMEWSAKFFHDWNVARKTSTSCANMTTAVNKPASHKWKSPAMGSYKLNTDAAVRLGEETYSIGLVLRDHHGDFVTGMVKRLLMVDSVLEVEVAAIREGIHWLSMLPYDNVEIETDSLLAVQAIEQQLTNSLKVGFVVDECRTSIISRPGLSIIFAKRQANKAAHFMARVPCLLDCQSIFTSPPNMLLETLVYDVSF